MAGCDVLGVDTYVGDVDDAARAVVDRARSGRGGYVCLANAHVLVTAQHDTALRGALERAWLALPDGAPVAWLQRGLGARGAQRVAGAELMERVVAAPGLRHALFGSTPEVLDRLSTRFGSSVVAAVAPPFGDLVERNDLVAEVRAARPDVVWVGLGAPKQELWMARWADELAPAVLLGVGAAFDFLAGTKPRAPEWMQRAGLEWLHRLRSEPRRLARRYVRTNGEFIVRAARELTRARRAA